MEIFKKLNPNVVNTQVSGIRKIADAVMQIKGIIRMDIGEPDFDTPIHIKDAAIKALRAIHHPEELSSFDRGMLDLLRRAYMQMDKPSPLEQRGK